MRPRWSERLLRRAMGNAEAFEGLVGDLREERRRRGRGAGSTYDWELTRLAARYAFAGMTARSRFVGGRRHATAGALGTLADDLRFAVRLLRRRRAYAVALAGTLALGFGAAAAVLSVAYGVWLRPLPYGNPGALVRVYELELPGDTGGALAGQVVDPADPRRSRVSPPLLWDLDDHDFGAISRVAAISGLAADWSTGGELRRISGVTASRGVFEVLQLPPVAGRFFSPEAGVQEVVLSEGFWRREFGGDPDILGRATLDLAGTSYRAVGVVRDGLPYPEIAPDFWVPMDPRESDRIEGMRGARYLDVIARLADAASLEAARVELDAFLRGLADDHPNHVGWSATAVPLRQDIVRPFAGVVGLLSGAAGLFLLIACANVAGLVSARRVRDREEHGLRLALGASRWRVLRQELAESVLVAAAAGVGAVLLARWALAPLRQLAPADIPRIAQMRLDPVVGVAMALLLMAASIAIALLGRGLAGSGATSARADSRTTSSNTRGRSALMAVQVALTTVLLLGGVTLASHFRDLASIEPGFVPDDVFTTPIVLGNTTHPDPPARLAFFEAVVDELRRRGHEAAVATNLPMAGTTMRFGYRVGGPESEEHWSQYHVASPGYFRLMGIPLLEGRAFGADDRDGGPPVAIVSAALAREHFGDDAVGREITVVNEVRRIVGVVGSVRHFGPDQPAPAEVYVPLAQDPWQLGDVVVRPGPGFAADSVRAAAVDVDPRVPVQESFGIDRFVGVWFAPLRFQLTVVGLLAVIGSVLAAIGLYALIAYVVAGRTREIGIRIAVGEAPRSIFVRVLAHGAAIAGIGLALGLGIAVAARGALRALGTGFDDIDPTVVVAVGLLVTLAAVLASAWPARRAASVDPATALRAE